MVIITSVYVIATIKICSANIKSANSTKDQLEESKREHEESLRLGIMPFLQFESYSDSDYDFEIDLPLYKHDSCDRICPAMMRLTNIGNGAATNIIYSWENKEFSISFTEPFQRNAIKAGGEYVISFVFDGYSKAADSNKSYILTFQYDDMRGYTYEQRMIFSFYFNGESIGIAEIETEAPKYTNAKFLG